MTNHLSEIINYLQISPTIGTAGQPTADQFNLIREAGYQAVINLALKESPDALPDEEKTVTTLGMRYFHIPVIWEKPTKENLETFFQTLGQLRDQKVFIHCVLNMRVSVFVYLYRIKVLGEKPEAAYQDILEIWEPETVWEEFILKQ